MFLKDLYRYRTTPLKRSREDFLSACLAELMRRDVAACAVVLRAVGFVDLVDLEGCSVRTQVGRADSSGRMRWCDVLVEPRDRNAACYVIECKVGDQPRAAQLDLYARLWATPHVALLAPEGRLPDAGGAAWRGKAMGSWQGVWEGLYALSMADDGSDRFRKALLDLMAHRDFDLAGRPQLSTQQMAEAMRAREQLEVLRAPMRDALLALLGGSVVDEPVDAGHLLPERRTQPIWGEGGPLNAYLERRAARDGTRLLGLGLDVREREGVGHADIDWYLSICPSPTLARQKVMLKDAGWESVGGWWERALGDVGGPSTAFGEQLVRAVAEARRWLARAPLNLSTGRRGVVVGNEVDLPGSVVAEWVVAERGLDAATGA